MKLEDIGFYTLSDERAKNSSVSSQLKRCELILTGKCNFKCPYCRSVGGKDIPLEDAKNIVSLWIKDNLQSIRFSGGEPTLYKGLEELVSLAKNGGIQNIAISSNGSAPFEKYKRLVDLGVTDFSISLDACCAEDANMMAGRNGFFPTIIDNIRTLSKICYVTVGVVLTEQNSHRIADIIRYADSLGVSDIRIIPAAQEGQTLPEVNPGELNGLHPILRYRLNNINKNIPVRGLSNEDSNKCGLVLDDMAVMGDHHYPCIIYMREGGSPIGKIGENMRKEREDWYLNHNTHTDPICSKNCLDVCKDYNNKFAQFRG